MTQMWTVARIFSKRAQRIADEAGELGCGTNMPIYKSVRYAAGKEVKRDRQLLPGYLFVSIRSADDWNSISELEGVYDLLPCGSRGAARLDAEMTELCYSAIRGRWNELEAPPLAEPVRRRRSRPSRRARLRARAARGEASDGHHMARQRR